MMVITSNNGKLKIKIDGIMKTKIMSTTLILVIDWWNNQVVSIKYIYHSVTLLCFGQIFYDRKGYNTMNNSGEVFVMERRW